MGVQEVTNAPDFARITTTSGNRLVSGGAAGGQGRGEEERKRTTQAQRETDANWSR